MAPRYRWIARGLVMVLVVGSGLFVISAGSAEAASTSVTNVRWSKPRVDVASKPKTSRLKVTVSDRDGVCSVWVQVARKGGPSFSGYLGFDSGSSTRGTWGAPLTWYLPDRGTWRVTALAVGDCDGHVYFQKRKKGIGGKLVVYSSKKIAHVRASSIPGSLLRGAHDTANVTLTAGGKRIKHVTVRLKACDNNSYDNCWTLGSARTNSRGVAKVKYTMPRQDVIVYGAFAGNRKVTYGYSGDHSINVRWKKSRISMTLTVSPARAADDTGSATATVRFGRAVCDAMVTLDGTVDYSTFVDGCSRTVTFDLSEYNFTDADEVHRFLAKFDDPGDDIDDSYWGRSNTVTFVVPPPLI